MKDTLSPPLPTLIVNLWSICDLAAFIQNGLNAVLLSSVVWKGKALL